MAKTGPHQKPHFNDYSFALKEVFQELGAPSDRAAAVLSVAYLEALIGRMVGQGGKAIDRVRTLEREFTDLEPWVFSDLKLVLKVRNRFSHWWEQVSFNHGPVPGWCDQLEGWKAAGSDPGSHRGRFVSSVHHLAYRLLMSWGFSGKADQP